MDNTSTAPIAASTARDPDDLRQVERIRRAIAVRSFAVVSTVSPAGFPHAAGVVYAAAGSSIYVHTMRSSRKARNIVDNERVAVVIPFRKLPVGPPFTVQFQARAAVLDMDDHEITAHLDAGRLRAIAGHGALDEPDGCFLRIRPIRTVHSYGIGVSAIALARDPLHVGARSVELDEGSDPGV